MNELSAEQLDPRALLQVAALGDPDAYQLLYTRYLTPVYRFFVSQTKGRGEAEVLTEKTLLKTYQGLGEFAPHQSHPPHFFLTTAHTILSEHNTPAGEKSNQPVVEVVSPSNNSGAGHESSDVHRALQNLTPEQREVLVLRFMNELSVAEIAVLLQKSEGSVLKIQRAGLKDLQKLLASQS